MGDSAKGGPLTLLNAGQDMAARCSAADSSYVMGSDVFVFPKMKDVSGTAAQAKLESLMLDPVTQIAFNTKKGSVPARTDLDVSSMDTCAQRGVALLKDPKKQLPSITYLISPDETGALNDVITQYLNTPSETPDDFVAKFAAAVKASQ